MTCRTRLRLLLFLYLSTFDIGRNFRCACRSFKNPRKISDRSAGNGDVDEGRNQKSTGIETADVASGSSQMGKRNSGSNMIKSRGSSAITVNEATGRPTSSSNECRFDMNTFRFEGENRGFSDQLNTVGGRKMQQRLEKTLKNEFFTLLKQWRKDKLDDEVQSGTRSKQMMPWHVLDNKVLLNIAHRFPTTLAELRLIEVII